MTPSPIPEGLRIVSPFLAIHRAHETIEFLKAAFAAIELETHVMPDGRILNAIVKIGDSTILIGERPSEATAWPAMLYMYTEDVDSTFRDAVRAGGRVVLEPTDQFYGERSGAVEDPSGNQWWIATHTEDLSREELVARAMKRGR